MKVPRLVSTTACLGGVCADTVRLKPDTTGDTTVRLKPDTTDTAILASGDADVCRGSVVSGFSQTVITMAATANGMRLMPDSRSSRSAPALRHSRRRPVDDPAR